MEVELGNDDKPPVTVQKDESSPLIESSLPQPQPSDAASFKLYTKRWFVLASFMLLNLSNGWIWVTWSPLTALVADYWEVDQGKVDALSGIYMYVFVPTNFFSMWLVVNHLGLSKGLLLGACLNAIGSAVRFGGADSYTMVYLGTFICALAQTFILPMVALLSGNWFGAHERATATSLGVLAYQTGMGMGLASTVAVEFRLPGLGEEDTTEAMDPSKLSGYLEGQLVASLIALLMVIVNVRTDRAPTPPSTAAASLRASGVSEALAEGDGMVTVIAGGGQAQSYKESVKLIYNSPASMAFFLVFGLSIGVFYAIPTFLSQFFPSWPPSNRGYLGGIFQLMAIIGCFAAGKIVDSFHQHYRTIGLMLMTGATVSVAGLLVAVSTESYFAMVACAGIAFCLSAFMSVGIEFGTALTFPADEAAVYGCLDSTAELAGFLLVTLGGAINKVSVGYIGFLLSIMSLSLALLWSIRGESKRPS
jgi:MFS family permease